MADVTRHCVCGKDVVVSESAASPDFCPQCGRRMGQNPPHADASRLKLASMQNRASLVSAEVSPEAPPSAPGVRSVPASHRREDRQAGRFHAVLSLRLQSLFAWVLFLVLLAVLLHWQWQGRGDARLLKSYLAARWALAVGAWLVVLLPAFMDTWVQGTLCLLVPPYAVYYALNRLPQLHFRAIFFAVLLTLAAEYYLLPDQTLAGLIQMHVTAWGVDIHGFVHRAARTLGTY